MLFEGIFVFVCAYMYAYTDRLSNKIKELDADLVSVRNELYSLRKTRCLMCSTYFVTLDMSKFCDSCAGVDLM
jgi:hypothetical protein